MSNWLVELKAPTFSDFFTLDDPVKGQLDNTEHRLGDFVNITARVRQISVNRGRSKLLEKFTAGNCSIILDNRDRFFDPTNVNSPFFGEIAPRKDIKISYLGDAVFTGSVTDWNFDYTFADATAEIVAHDSLTRLATTLVPAGTLSEQTIVARINNVLDLVSWDADLRNIDNDLLILGQQIIGDDVNTLSYLQKIELSSNGLLFIDKDGVLKYIFRYQGDAINITVGIDDGIPTNAFNVNYGSEELVNKVTVNYFNNAGATLVTVEDTVSQESYGVLERSYDTLLFDYTDAENLAQQILERYKNPTYRIDEIGFAVDGLSSEQLADLMSIELGNKIKLKWRPLGVGDLLYRSILVDSISHDVTPGTHTMKMKVTDLGVENDIVATGGSYTTDFIDPTDGELYRMHVYDTVGTFDFTIDGSLDIEVLIIGGGGSRQWNEESAGGGGGGGVVTGLLELEGTQTISVTVGDAGVMLPSTPTAGGNSSFGDFVAPGGGMGGAFDGVGGDPDGGDGGSGGGATGSNSFVEGVGFVSGGVNVNSGGLSVHDDVSPLDFYGNDGGDNVTGAGYRGGHGGSADYTSTFTGVSRTYGVGGRGFRNLRIYTPEDAALRGIPAYPIIGSFGQGEGLETIIFEGSPATGEGIRFATQGAVFIRYQL